MSEWAQPWVLDLSQWEPPAMPYPGILGAGTRDPYRRTEAEERQSEDDEALEWLEQHAEDKPDPEHRA